MDHHVNESAHFFLDVVENHLFLLGVMVVGETRRWQTIKHEHAHITLGVFLSFSVSFFFFFKGDSA